MAESVRTQVSALFPDPVWRFFRDPFSRQTLRNLVYLLLAFPLGLAYFVLFTVGLSVSIALMILVVGIILLLTFLVAALLVANLERAFTNLLLGTSIEGEPWNREETWKPQVKAIVLDRRTWTSIIYLPVKFVFGLVGFVSIFIGLSTAFAMIMVPFYYDRPGVYVGIMSERAPEVHQTIYLGWNYLLVGVDAAFTLGYWEIESLGAALLVAVFGLLLILGTLHWCNALTWVWKKYAYWSMDGGVQLISFTSKE